MNQSYAVDDYTAGGAPDNSGTGVAGCDDSMYALGISFGASCCLLLVEQWLGSSSCDASSISQLIWKTVAKLDDKGIQPPALPASTP